MKTILLFSFFISSSLFAGTIGKKQICESLQDEAISNCEISMCEDWLRDEGTPITKKNTEECINKAGGDLLEGAQICAEGEIEVLIKAYNLKNPKNKIRNCNNF